MYKFVLSHDCMHLFNIGYFSHIIGFVLYSLYSFLLVVFRFFSYGSFLTHWPCVRYYYIPFSNNDFNMNTFLYPASIATALGFLLFFSNVFSKILLSCLFAPVLLLIIQILSYCTKHNRNTRTFFLSSVYLTFHRSLSFLI